MFLLISVRPLVAALHRKAASITPRPAASPTAPRSLQAQPVGSTDLASQFKEMAALRDSGALTADEFEAAKKKLLRADD